jgi:triosephosphate isomerase
MFVANWKMNGTSFNFKEVSKVGVFLNKNLKKYKKSIIFCPPLPLLTYFSKKNANNNIQFGAQNLSNTSLSFGAATGSISASMAKTSGAEYVILGHSESRSSGDSFLMIKNKILNADKTKLKIIFCMGETLSQKNIIFAYEPVWSIGTGLVPSSEYLEKIFLFLNNYLKKNFKIKSPKILYGGSVNAVNIKDLRSIKACSGYLVGGASLKAKNFIEIIKNYYN